MQRSGRTALSRRRLLELAGGTAVGALAGCVDRLPGIGDDGGSEVTPRTPVTAEPDRSVTLTAASGTIQPSPETSAANWLYEGAFPGPQLRVQEGDVLSAELVNDLQEETTIHWHGVPVPNPVDGVPNVTQEPTAPGETFTYKFRAEPPGTYFYHSHVGLQLDRGLLGPLIVEERDPHIDYDREYVVVVDDYLPQAPRLPTNGGSGGGGMGGGGMGDGRGGRGGMMGDARPPYEGLLINGRLPENQPTFDVTEGDRVRFRFVNAASATVFGVRIAGHEMSVTHADGRPVEPVDVDSFVFGSGERYDVVVEATNPGTWSVQAAALDGNEPPASALLRYDSSDNGARPQQPSSSGDQLQYGDLQAVNSLSGIDGRPDRTFDLTLSRGSGQSYTWTIDGEAYPDAEPLDIQLGEHVRIRMTNQSPVVHPMHLHGHFFEVGNALKDTVIVPGHRGQVTLDFHADNPGRWLFHCHNLYHLDAGMARVIRYVE